MNEKQITRINGVEILTVERDGEVYVPIKPICEAIGVDIEAQRDKIQADDILESVAVTITATGGDGKAREMHSLPLQYVYGWIFTINPKNVAPEARDAVTRYRRECYEVLYRHFHTALQKQIRSNREELRLMNELNQTISDGNRLKAHRKRLEEQLARLRAERLDDNPTLFDDVDAAQC